jgi:hypothetical protein
MSFYGDDTYQAFFDLPSLDFVLLPFWHMMAAALLLFWGLGNHCSVT